MNRGVFCIIQDRVIPTHLLRDVLMNVDVTQYIWAVDCIVELSDNDFEEKVYDGENFLKEIQSEHLLNFIRVRRYSKESMIDKEVGDYGDYERSSCTLVFLCIDCYYLDIYAKDPDDLKKIFVACQKLNHRKLEYITDVNDERTGFLI